MKFQWLRNFGRGLHNTLYGARSHRRRRSIRKEPAMIETCEPRTVMAANLMASVSEAGVLTIEGTDNADHITVREVDVQIVIEGIQIAVNGKLVNSVATSSIHRIEVNSLGGNDRVELAGSAHGRHRTINIPSVINGGDGNDSLFGGAANDTIDGGAGNDVINGNGGADTIIGGTGNDRLRGGLGNDSLSGGDGDDRVDGGIGADVLQGDAGKDSLRGSLGNDTLRGGMGNDTLSGGGGADKLFGDGDADQLSGGRGNDQLDGGAGDDSLAGDRGRDSLKGGSGTDTLAGGRGKDRLFKDIDDVFTMGHGDVFGDFTMADVSKSKAA